MIVLGLSLGHDASATILREGKVVAHALRERHSGVRHHLGIDRATIEIALGQAGVTVADISAISIAATQQMPSLVNDPDYLYFCEKISPESTLRNFRLIDNPYWRDAKDKLIVERWAKDNDPPQHALNYLLSFEQNRRIPMATHKNWEILGILSPLYGPQEWLSPYQLHETGDKMGRFLSLTRDANELQAFHFPLEIELAGRSVPGWFINHHMAHAASSFFSSPAENSLIFTHDGGTGSDSGFMFIGSGSSITGLGPHYLECGQFYDYAAQTLGLGAMGGAGKLMGLASYGSGRLNDVIPVGTRLDWENWTIQHAPDLLTSPYKAIFDALVTSAEKHGLDTTRIGQADYVLSGAPPEIAHACQDALEKSIFSSISQTVSTLRVHGLDAHSKNLCISGGVALNCPANSKLWNSGIFQSVHIEPHCEDGGLSIGAAQYAYHQLMGGLVEE
jgi:carbamoyltransferase